MLAFEKRARQKGFELIIGIDEAGRGPLAGPVVASAVSLREFKFKSRISDSKKVLVVTKELFSYLIIIDIEKDFHSRKAIGDALKYIKNKAGYYKFQPEDINFTYDLIKNDIDNRSGRNVF